MLLELARLLVHWRPAFARRMTCVRVVNVLLGLLIASGRRTLTASITARGREFEPWAADYLAFSRAPWEVASLFDAVVDAAVETVDRVCPGGRYLLVAVDDTGLPKTGKSIADARWMRDPLSPPFHLNLRWGLRYVHLAMILPLHTQKMDPRAISIDFAPAPSIKKPGRKATDQQRADYKEAQKQKNLSKIMVERVTHLREHADASGHRQRLILAMGDGSYTNRNVLGSLPDRVEYLGRTRGDLALFKPADPGGRKVYGERLPTPNAVRQDPNHPWTHTELFYAGEMRKVRFKSASPVLWRTGGQRRPLRILVIAPTPYRAASHARRRWYYRDPAYLLTTDLTTPAEELIQAYLARWQIEVEHRDQKSGLGVGHAQVWNGHSVARLHSAHVAMWSMVKLAALRTFGMRRTDAYPERPGWYPQEQGDRASQRDIIDVLRADLQLQPIQPTARRLPRPKRVPPTRRRLTPGRVAEAA